MKNIVISKLGINQTQDFFNLFKKIAKDDFARWTSESKKAWFDDQYNINFWNKITQEGLPIFVAILNDQMIGYVAIEDINFGVAYLGWVGVMKEYQFQGIGSRLMTEVEKWCRKNNIHKIELETQEPELRKFYEKHNYILEGIRKNSWQNLDNYMFGKVLNS